MNTPSHSLKSLQHKSGEIPSDWKVRMPAPPLTVVESAAAITAAALKRSERRYDLIAELSADAIYWHDRTGKIVAVNSAACALLGYTREELLARTVTEIAVTPDEAEYENLWATLEEGSTITLQKVHCCKNGKLIPVEMRIGVVEGEEGPLMVSFARNIAERLRFEEEIRTVTTYANCILWHANIELRGDEYVWDFHISDVQAAQRFSPLELQPNETYEQAWLYRIRSQEDTASGIAISRNALRQNKTGFDQEFQISRADGDLRWISENVRLNKIAEGRWLAVGVCTDITEQKRASERQQMMTQGLRLVQATADEMLGCATIDDVLRKSVELLRHKLGFERVGIHLCSEDGAWLNGTYGTNERGETTNEQELHLRVADNREFSQVMEENGPPWTLFTKTPLCAWVGKEQRVIGEGWRVSTPIRSSKRMIGILFNDTALTGAPFDSVKQELAAVFCARLGTILEVKHGEEAQRESHNRLLTIIENLPNHVFVKNVAGEYLIDNAAHRHFLGVKTADEIVGKTVWDLFPLELAAIFDGVDCEIIKSQKAVFDQEERAIDAEGNARILSTSKIPLLDTHGSVIGLIGVSRDLTDQKKLEAQLLRSQRLESIGTLASGVAHDLNNILAPIMMAVPLLQEHDDKVTKTMLLATIESCAQRGADIVKQVLTFARGVEGERVLLQPNHLINEIIKITRETFPRSISIEAKIPEALWPILGDSTQLHQVLLNLCVNARDAMPEGGSLMLSAENINVDDRLAITMQGKAGPHILLRVRDSGTGIPIELLDKIFDPFFTTKDVGKGTGLGLSTLVGIVKGHGGFVCVESEIGAGSLFKIYLPAAPGMEQEFAENQEDDLLPMATGETILLVDDEPSIRTVAQTILERQGYKVIAVGDGNAALEVYAQEGQTIQAVITDVMMPRMDGVALIRALRAIRPDLRVIASTGQACDLRTSELAELHVNAMLQKPFTHEKLLNTLREVLTASAR